jgi:hypothetical protein
MIHLYAVGRYTSASAGAGIESVGMVGYGLGRSATPPTGDSGMGVEAKRATSNGHGSAIQLKLSLRGVSKPTVWRRLLVPADIRL